MIKSMVKSVCIFLMYVCIKLWYAPCVYCHITTGILCPKQCKELIYNAWASCVILPFYNNVGWGVINILFIQIMMTPSQGKKSALRMLYFVLSLDKLLNMNKQRVAVDLRRHVAHVTVMKAQIHNYFLGMDFLYIITWATALSAIALVGQGVPMSTNCGVEVAEQSPDVTRRRVARATDELTVCFQNAWRGLDKMSDISGHFLIYFLKGKLLHSVKIWRKFVPNDPINNNPAWVQVMAWCRWVTNHYWNQC